MNILFMGLIYDGIQETSILEKSKIGLQASVNHFQWKIINGIRENREKVSIISTIPIATYPKYKDILVKSKISSECLNELGFINIPVFKQISRFYNARKALKQYIRCHDGTIHIIVYQSYLPFIIAALLEHEKDIKIYPIIADMVGKYGVLPNKLFKRIGRLIYGYIMNYCICKCDGIIAITSAMVEALSIESKPHVTIEGIAEKKNIYKGPYEYNEVKTLFYSGSLGRKSNVLELVKQFSAYKDESIKLLICGSGGDEKYIIEYAKNDKRIEFLGFVEHDKALELQRKADILINPRKCDLFTKYSFPSKLIEYLGTGKPVITNRLIGIPDEYDPFLHYFKTDNMIDDIIDVLKQGRKKLECQGELAKNFLEKNKLSLYQAKKIITLLEKNE